MSSYVDRWNEFFSITGLHGYKYIVLEGVTYKERICWAIVVLLFLIISLIFVWTAWNWNAENPTLTVIESTHYAIQNYPFPAVTICDMNGVSRTMALRKANTMKLPKGVTVQDVFQYLKYATALLGTFSVPHPVLKNLTILQMVLDLNDISVEQLIRDITPSCREIIQRCSWKRIMYSCDLLFMQVKTVDGFCCSFNYYAMPFVNITRRAALFTPSNPRKVASCGFSTGLTFLIEIKPQDYYSTVFASYGFRIMIHDAYNYPDENSQIRLVSPNTEVYLSVSPEATYSTDAVQAFPISSRHCTFDHERSSSVFTRYSYHNCLFQCRAKIIARKCECIPYYIPMPTDDILRTCNFNDLECLNEAKGDYEVSTPQLLIANITSDKCECSTDCNSYNYPIEVATGKLTRRGSFNAQTFFKEVTLRNHSLVNVFFGDLVSTRYRRDVYLNWHNLLASFGGLLGLFVGFSFVSGFEFLYFFTIRVLFDLYARRKKIFPDSSTGTSKNRKDQDINDEVQVINVSERLNPMFKIKDTNNFYGNRTQIAVISWNQFPRREYGTTRKRPFQDLDLFHPKI